MNAWGSLAMRSSNSMSPFFLVAGFVDRLGEEFVGLAHFRVVLVEIRVKHPHQLPAEMFMPAAHGAISFGAMRWFVETMVCKGIAIR
ncbi:MAG: hypothetical protein MUF86_05710 [Akkermansiaceae bacterium]|jgi:hypothetical protein|nr:hypothetical protein [Akkermansiaceae bacterium]